MLRLLFPLFTVSLLNAGLSIKNHFKYKAKLALPLILGVLFFLPQAFAVETNIKVVTSTRPIHSLVSAVMEGVGTPYLIVQGAGSPHNYALKPNDARALQSADIVFWTGPQLETFLIKPLTTIVDTNKAINVPLVDAEGIKLLPQRDNENFEPHHHDGDEAANHDGHSHNGHSHDHDNHGQDTNTHDDHTHDTAQDENSEHFDAHLWLDPENAIVMVDEIASQLAKTDPSNAEKYQTNAKAYKQRLEDLMQKTADKLAPVKGKPLLVFHDAYQYFENRFGVDVVGSVTINPEHQPSSQHIRALRQKVQNLGAVCIFSEPQFQPKLIDTIIEGTKVKTGVLDPLGYNIPEGPDQYITLIENLSDSIVQCVSE